MIGAILAVAGMASKVIGGEEGGKSTVEGAETQARIEKLGREYQGRRFERDIEYQRPFYEAGEKAITPYQEAIKNRFDVTQSPLYRMQQEMIMGELGTASESVKSGALARLGAREGEAAKSRLADLQQIGLGSAASAGSSNINYGSALASSLQRGGMALAQGQLSAGMQQQNTWMGVAEGLSGYPAYREQQNYLNSWGPSSAPMSQQQISSPTYPANQGGGVLGGASPYVLR